MKTDETIDPEVRKLLEDLAEPHANQQRQQQLAELIDNLAAQEQPPVTPAKKHTRLWAWVGIAAAAACLLLFIIRMPDSTVENAMPSAPLLADDNKPVEVDTDVVETVSPTHNVASPKVERTELLAEARDVEPIEEAVVPIINDEREDNVIITEEKTDEDHRAYTPDAASGGLQHAGLLRLQGASPTQ